MISGNSWMNVVSADITRAAWIRITESAGESPATPATMMAGVTHPTIMATTCCIASGSACDTEGFPSILNNSCEIAPASSLLMSFVSFLSFFLKKCYVSFLYII